MAYQDSGRDDQDSAETFDEDMTEGDNPALEGSTFEDLPDVYDVTRARGDDSDIVERDEADFDDDVLDEEELDEEDEVLDEDTYEDLEDEVDPAPNDSAQDDPDDIDQIAARGRDEVELDYQPDVDNRRGARAGAGGFESRGELDEDDLEELGYAADEEEEQSEDHIAADRRPREDADTPHARPAERPLKTDRAHDHLPAHHRTAGEDRQEALLDEAVDETFPASDPISPKHIT
jgi:hypothetical protein